MKRLPWGGIFLAIALWGIPLEKAASLNLSLPEALEMALEQSLTLRKSAITLSTAKLAADRFWAEVFPGISLGAGVSYGSPLFTGKGFQADPKNLAYNTSLGLTFQLNTGIPAAIKSLRLAYEAGLLDYQSARRQLSIQVSKDFYNLLAETQKLSNLEEIRSLAERQLEKDRTAFENGLLSQLSYLQSRLGAETARLDVSKARTGYTARLGDFLVLLGLDRKTEIILEGSIDIEYLELDSEALIQAYLSRNPSVISQRNTIERLELARRRALLASRAPSLTLSASWRGSGDAAPGSKFSDSLSGSVNLSIPVEAWIPGAKANQSVRSAGAEIEKAMLDLKNAENQAKAQIRSLTENLRTSWETIEIARLRADIAARSYALTEERFRNGAAESLVLEDARNSMAQARQQLLEAELAYKIMTLDLSAALNADWDEAGRILP